MSTSPFFFKAFLGTNGRPAASGWLFAYAAGSTTPKPIFSDRNNTIPLANPLRLDGNGVAPQFFTESGLYDFKVFEYNFVTPDEPGPSCFTAEDIDGVTGGGGGDPYVLPIATASTLGGVKPDEETTFVDPVTGVLSAPAGAPYTLPTATTDTLGGVKPDGVTVQVDPSGVLSVIPDEMTPEVSGYSEGGYTELMWRNNYTDIIGKATFKRGANLFKISDLAAGMVLVTRWSGTVTDASTVTDLTTLAMIFDGESGPEFDRAGAGTTHEINYVLTTRYFAYQVTETEVVIYCQSHLEYSDNSGDKTPDTTPRLRYWSVSNRALTDEISVGMYIYNTSPNFENGYRQYSFQAWMENAQVTSTPDPALLFQPLEDQRLSKANSTEFAAVTAKALRVDTAAPDTTPVIGSTFWDADAKTIATHVENGSTLQHGQELVLYARNNSGVNILDGQCVYITGANGNKCTIALADSDNRTASHIIAVATQDINNNADGYVTLAGRVNDIDTSAFAEGAEVWLGDVPGSLVSTIPSGANVRARVGYIIRSHATQGALEVSINRYPFFSELSGNGVTTRTTTSATSAPTRFVRYTGTGGHTEPLPTATTISADRYYRNSGTGPWTITANGGDLIDPGNPAALVSSVTLLPGQTLHIYVALTGLWEAF